MRVYVRMKRQITALMALLIMLVLFSACGSEKNKQTLQEADHSGLTEDAQVTLEMDFPDYTGKEEWTYCIFSNDAEQDLCYGLPEMEVLIGGTWYTIPEKEGTAHTMELPYLSAGYRGAVHVPFSDYARDFSLGQYRIVVPYTFGAYTTDKGWDHMATAEFSIVKKAKRTDYQPFVGQIYEPDKAVKGGVIAISGDKIYGEEILETFFYKALSGVPCEMRIVYPELDLCEHYVYKQGCYTIQSYEHRAVTTRCYSYVYIDPVTEDLTFTNYVDPDQAVRDGFSVSEPEDVFALDVVSEETQAYVQKVHQKDLTYGPVLRVCLFGPERDVLLVRMDDAYMIGYDNNGSGQLLEIDQRPVSIRAVSETAAVVQFEKTDGSLESRIFDVEKGGFE